MEETRFTFRLPKDVEAKALRFKGKRTSKNEHFVQLVERALTDLEREEAERKAAAQQRSA